MDIISISVNKPFTNNRKGKLCNLPENNDIFEMYLDFNKNSFEIYLNKKYIGDIIPTNHTITWPLGCKYYMFGFSTRYKTIIQMIDCKEML